MCCTVVSHPFSLSFSRGKERRRGGGNREKKVLKVGLRSSEGEELLGGGAREGVRKKASPLALILIASEEISEHPPRPHRYVVKEGQDIAAY